LTATEVYLAAASIESWTKTSIGQVTLRDWSVQFRGGGTREQAAMTVHAPGADARPLPAWGFYVRKVDALRLEDVRLDLDTPDARPPLIAEDVATLALDGLRLAKQAGQPPVVLENVAHVSVRDAEMGVVPSRCLDLVVQPVPFSVTARVQGGPIGGLAKIDLAVGEKTVTRWIWLAADEKKDVPFSGIQPPGPGVRELRCGQVTRNWPANP
jgi:hypothetical protein